MAGFTLPDSPAFDEWQFFESQDLRRKLAGALAWLAHGYGVQGERERALACARRWAALDPLHEPAHRLLMDLYARSGQRGDALRQYAECERILREELNAQPEEETRQLYRAIREHRELPGPTGSITSPVSPPDGFKGPPRHVPAQGRHNLPAQTTSFVGREVQLSEICELLARPGLRLLTLTGAGGAGKTRLALQVAAGLVDTYPDGVAFVPLAPVRDPGLVPSAVAERLGVEESPESTLLDALKYVLRQKRALLLLDNFEHVASAAPLVSELLAAAPGLTVLVTSRVPLHLYAEHVYVVPPMAVPGADDLPPVARLAQVEAVQLFVQRAQQVRQDFSLNEGNAQAVAQICTRLDGLPLAVELAAARARLFSPEALLPRLDSSLHFLTGGPRDLPARQRTLRATIAWSHALLDDDARAFFRRLSVFHGGCSEEAAEAVCLASWPAGVPPPALDLLASLVDQNLLQATEVDGEMRFTMLETVREYAVEQLDARGPEEAGATRERHARYYLALAEAIDPRLPTVGSILAIRLERELDNLRTALSWSLAHLPEVGVRLAGALSWFWNNGYVSEGRVWLDKALAASRERGTADRWRALALGWAGWLAHWQNEPQIAEELITESVALCRQLGEPRLLARALSTLMMGVSGREPEWAHALAEEQIALLEPLDDKAFLAIVYAEDAVVSLYPSEYERALARIGVSLDLVRQVEGASEPFLAWPRSARGQLALALGDYAAARLWFEQAAAIGRSLEYKPNIGNALFCLGECWHLDGDCDRARGCYAECLALTRAAGQRGMVTALLGRLGHVALCQGAWGEARSHLKEALVLCREMARMGSGDAVGALIGCAGLAQAQGQPERAARLFGAAVALQASAGGELTPAYVPLRDRVETTLRTELDEAVFAAAWREGEAMAADGGEQVVAYALGEEI